MVQTPLTGPTHARIRAARKAAGLSRDDLASALDVSYKTIQNYETGASAPPVGRLGDLASALGVEARDLIGSTSSSTPAPRPSVTDLLGSEEAMASDPLRELARAGGSVVARGFDDDGLMYAVEIVFHVRPGSRDTRHSMSEGGAGPAHTDG